jgi:D-alanyl-D-alanine carboxypeptidase
MSSNITIPTPRTALRAARRRHRTVAAGVAASALVALAAGTGPPVAAAHAPAATAPSAAHGHDRAGSVGPRLQAIINRAARAPGSGIPGVALYVRVPGQRPWSGAAGTANVHRGTPMRADDRFRAGSIAKTFVAAATLQLVEEGRFSLDDPLPAVLPARVLARFPQADRITVRMLLEHTSGLADYTNDPRFNREVATHPRRRWTVGEFLDRAAAMPATGAPGEHFAYSNTDYNLLGLVIEQATGKPWRTVLRERIFAPLHLVHTSLPEPGTVQRARDIAHGYQRVGGRLYDLTHVDSSMAGAAGGNALLTSTEDLSRFLRALFAGRLFQKPETVTAMRAFLPTPNDHGRVGYGMGLERYLLPGGLEVVGHMGTGAGYRAFMFHLPAQHVDISMALTSPADPTPVLFPVLKALVAAAS